MRLYRPSRTGSASSFFPPKEKFPPEKIVEIDREGESAHAITERLFPLIHGREVLKAEKEL
ncbi:MAG: hypothetical protein IJU93_05795 [Lachnospiraceae bacterium]|nr:hypothetical protein [Lachnospiraceae bacterium]